MKNKKQIKKTSKMNEKKNSSLKCTTNLVAFSLHFWKKFSIESLSLNLFLSASWSPCQLLCDNFFVNEEFSNIFHFVTGIYDYVTYTISSYFYSFVVMGNSLDFQLLFMLLWIWCTVGRIETRLLSKVFKKSSRIFRLGNLIDFFYFVFTPWSSGFVIYDFLYFP